MIVPKKTMRKWETLRSPEDAKLLADTAGVSSVTIQAVFRKKKGSDKVIETMANFYNAKAEKIKELI